MSNLLKYLGVGKREQDDSYSKVITAADRVRIADEMAQAHEQKLRADEASEPVPAHVRPLTAPPERSPPAPTHSGEEPPLPMLSSHRRRKAGGEFGHLDLLFAKEDFDYEFRRGLQTVAILSLISKPKYGDQQWSLIIDGSSYELAVDLSKFYLRLDEKIVASASKRLFLSVFDVVWGFEKYKLKPRFFLSRKFSLLKDDRVVGSIAWEYFNNVNDTMNIPNEIELAVQIFIAWLVMYVDLHMRNPPGGGG